MAIVFTCECGRKLQVARELAGKKGKCPQCGKILVIPAESEPVQEEAPVPESDSVEAVEGETQSCPHCGELIAVGAVFCTSCGTDLRTGEKHEGGRDATTGYNVLKIWPDLLTKPMGVVGTVIDNPLGADNFYRALGLLGAGTIGFVLMWAVNFTPDYCISMKVTHWYYFVILLVVGLGLVAVDGVAASFAGKFFGSTGTSTAKTVMGFMLTNAVFGMMNFLLAIMVLFGRDYLPYEIMAQYGPWAFLIWAAFLTTVVIQQAYDTSPAVSAIFGSSSTVVKGLLIYLVRTLIA